MVCDWNVNKGDDGKYILTVNVNLSHYSLYVTKRTSVYTIGNTSGSFNTPDIRIDPEAGKQLTKFTTVTYVLSDEEIENGVSFSATWQFNGIYSGKPVEDVTASDTIKFN
jgi:hypothetical protein